ncbi:hypothetical protein ANN_01587 [Periplaneta americana]|uniref:Uncharacterized protein n=1 Tax=Periplaneta americana TaxID=6978 RepID=A0ABQ8TY29_PERAM|nr:hypothetical protein ANN_01587 [Periplaneta americana]
MVFQKDDKYMELMQFSDRFPEEPVPHFKRNAVRVLIYEFHETGSVKDADRSGKPRKLTEDKLLDISDSDNT